MKHKDQHLKNATMKTIGETERRFKKIRITVNAGKTGWSG